MEALIVLGASRGLGAQIMAKAVGHIGLRIGLARSGTYEEAAEKAHTAKIRVDIANHPELEATIGSLFLGLRGMVGLQGITIALCAADCLPGAINSAQTNALYQRSLQVNFVSPLIFVRAMMGFAKRAAINLDVASFTHKTNEPLLRHAELYAGSKAALASGLESLCHQYEQMRVQHFQIPLLDTQFFEQADSSHNFPKDFVEGFAGRRAQKTLVDASTIGTAVLESIKNPLIPGFSSPVL